mgnify:CR=1 FL=1
MAQAIAAAPAPEGMAAIPAGTYAPLLRTKDEPERVEDLDEHHAVQLLVALGPSLGARHDELGALARDAIRLGADSGLLDAPEIVDRRTVKVRALLQPGLVPGQRVVVDSLLVQGAVLRITEATFSGDTAGASWDAELTLKRPPATLLNRSAPGVTAQNE